MTEQKKESVEELLEQTLPHVPRELRSKIEQLLYSHDSPKVFPGVTLVYHGDDLCIYRRCGEDLSSAYNVVRRMVWDADIMIKCLQGIQVELLPAQTVSLAKNDYLYFMFRRPTTEKKIRETYKALGTPSWLTATNYIRVEKDRYGDWITINRPEDHVETT